MLQTMESFHWKLYYLSEIEYQPYSRKKNKGNEKQLIIATSVLFVSVGSGNFIKPLLNLLLKMEWLFCFHIDSICVSSYKNSQKEVFSDNWTIHWDEMVVLRSFQLKKMFFSGNYLNNSIHHTFTFTVVKKIVTYMKIEPISYLSGTNR